MARNPMYSEHLEYAPTFKWGGREWGPNDVDLFRQFLRKRGGSFDRWARRHPTAAKTFDPVEGQLYSLFQPQLTGIEHEREKRQKHFAGLMRDLGGFSTALMGMLANIAPAIGGTYSSGADTMSALGNSYGASLNADQQASAEAANAVLRTIGSPEGQMLSGGDAGGVLAGLAGWIPSTMFREQGGAYADAAAQLPKSASIESQVMMKGLLEDAVAEEEDFSNQVMQLLQGLPGARQEIASTRRKERLDEMDFALDRLKQERDWHMKQAYLALAQGDRKRYQEQLRLAQQKEQRYQMEAQGLDPEGNPAPGYYRDGQGRVIPKGYRYNKRGELVQIQTPSSRSSGKSPKAKADDVKNVARYQDDIDRYIKGSMIKENPEPPFNEIRPPYKEAFEILWGRFKNTVKTDAGRRALKKAIHAALRAHGFTRQSPANPPGVPVPGPK